MNALMEYLDQFARTLTVYNHTGTDSELKQLEELLDSFGVRMQTVTTDSGPENVAVLHQKNEVLDACSVDSLLSETEFGEFMEAEQRAQPAMFSDLSSSVTVKPTQDVTEMVRISREYERRALREGSGTLHAGFQQLSQIAESDRTMAMYIALANEGVDVNVCGYPDATLEDVPFTVIEDTDGELEAHWYLLYDGDGNNHRKAALVSEQDSPAESEAVSGDEGTATTPEKQFNSYFTTDPEIVDTLFDLASNDHGKLLGLTD